MAHLSLVLEGREHVGPPQQLDVGVGVVGADLLDEVLEPNHGSWCLSDFEGVCRAPRPLRAAVDGVLSRQYTDPLVSL